MKKLIVALAVASVVTAASAATYDGVYVSGLQKSFFIADAGQTTFNVAAGIQFDPNSQVGGVYDKLYAVNRSAANAKRGLYSIDIINETTSARLALAGDSSNDLDSPSDVAIDSSGNAYVPYGGVPSVWKVADPSGTPVESQMLGNYGTAGDDDMYGIDMVPAGFGGGYASDSDVIIYDGGFNDNDHNAVTVVDSTSTVGTPLYTTIWSEANLNSIRGATSSYEGKVYISHWTLDLDDLGGTTNAYVLRLDNAGNTERIFLDIDPDLVPKLDDAITVNPEDGSLWMNIETADTTRDVIRVDVVNAADQGGGDFLASTTVVIEDLGYNVGAYSMAFSPDGEQLALGAPDVQDRLFVYDIIPEPATIGLFGILGVAMLWIRRKFTV